MKNLINSCIPVITLFIGLMIGGFHGKYISTQDMRKEAIKAGSAYYNPVTAEFTFGSLDGDKTYQEAVSQYCNALGFKTSEEIEKCMEK